MGPGADPVVGPDGDPGGSGLPGAWVKTLSCSSVVPGALTPGALTPGALTAGGGIGVNRAGAGATGPGGQELHGGGAAQCCL
jgi:hypothetical protein